MEPLRIQDPARVAGHRLLGRLGSGGMGVVYLARTPGGTLVALKVLHAEYAGEQDFRERFQREVEVARRVDSPWVVPLVDADPGAAEPWLATTFVPGPSLGEAVAAYGPLEGRGVRHLGIRLAEALGAVHRAGLVHRDLKPGNVLIAHDGPRLIDFGIARAPQDRALTVTGMVVGTPGYLSPEQADGRAGDGIGSASDVFSLGCVLAFAATGRAPFGGGAVDALLYRAVHAPADLDGVPAVLRETLAGCLDKDPDRRPRADEVARRLTSDPVAGGDEAPGSTRHDDQVPDWLPEPVGVLIAERSAAVLALPDVEQTLPPTDSPPSRGTAGPDTGPPSPPLASSSRTAGRRRFLLLAGGTAALAASAGGAWWTVGRDDSRHGPTGVSARRPVHTVALHGDLTGPHRESGQAQGNGLRLAVADFNARDDAPFRVKTRVVDDGGDPAAASRLAAELTDDPEVLAVVGPTTDETGQAALAAYDAGLLPVVAVSPGTTALSIQGFRSFLHARLPDAVLPAYVSNYLRHKGRSTRIGIVVDRSAGDYGTDLGGSLSNALGSIPYPSVPNVVSAMSHDFTDAVDTVLAAGADSVFFAGLPDRGALIAEALHARGFRGPRVSGPALLHDRFLTDARDSAQGWVMMAPVVDPTRKPEARAFATAYRRRFGRMPPRYAAEAYDVTSMLLTALARLPAKDRTRHKLLTAVRRGTYRGITKTFAFTATGMMVIDGTGGFLWRVDQGAFVYGGPAPATV